MKADRILLALGFVIILAVAGRLQSQDSDAAQLIVRECELFYRPVGAEAVRRCEAEMAAEHLPPGTAAFFISAHAASGAGSEAPARADNP